MNTDSWMNSRLLIAEILFICVHLWLI